MLNSPREATICFVLVYFGKWPPFWEFWARSAAANADVDFLILTDLPPPEYLPQNVELVHMTFREVMAKLQNSLRFDLNSSNFHKLCDFKGFFGLAFPELLADYPYWGYCDMDLIFGDLSPLVEVAARREFDLISPWTHTVGHCTVMRNVPEVIRAPLKIPNLETRLNFPETTFSDEGAMSETCVQHGPLSYFGSGPLPEEFSKPCAFVGATIKPGCVLWGDEETKDFAVCCEPKKVSILYPDGRSCKVMYFHFMAGKSARFWQRSDGRVPKAFSFAPFGYLPYLVKPADLVGASYRRQSAIARLRSNTYALLHRSIPEPVRLGLKALRRTLRGVART